MFSRLMREKHQQLWPAAIAAIEKGSPSLIGDNGVWESAYQDGVIDDRQYARYQHAVQSLYDRRDVEGQPVYTLKKNPALRESMSEPAIR